MIYKKSKKALDKKKVRRQKAKKIAIISAVVFSVLCLGAALVDGIFRVSTNIDGFEKHFSDVSSETRKSLRSELEQFVFLNTGNPATKTSKFTIRNEEEIEIKTDEDGNKYSSFVIDSEEMQLSARVQINWAGQFSRTKASFIVRVDCAEESKYENSHCYSKTTGEVAKAIITENIGLLKSYGVPEAAIKKAQKDMLDYLKIAYPNVESALVLKRTIYDSENAVRATLRLDEKSFDLEITKSKDWSIKLSSGNNLIWSTDANKETQSYRHYSILKKQLPAEVTTKNGSQFMLRYVDEKHLEINSVSCMKNEKDSELKDATREWLETNEFNSESFEIKLKISCES